MAAVPQALLNAKFPAYLTDKTLADTIDFKGGFRIDLFKFNFLGVDFATGVNNDLATRLINAQNSLYSQAFLDKVDELAQQGRPPPLELTKDEFKAWCWLGQMPASPGGAPQIQLHGGFGDRGNASSKHSSGSAIDMNYAACPWFPVRDAKGVHGGELHRTKDPSDPDKKTFLFKGDFRALHTEKLWKPAFEIFDRAHSLFVTKPLDLSPELDRAKAQETYLRMRLFSYVLQIYFRYAFNPANSGKSPRQKTFDEFKASFREHRDAGFHADTALHPDGTPLKAALEGPDPDGALKAYYDKIVEDFAFMPKVITVGKLKVDENGDITGPSGGQRDPCNGVFNIRQEVFMELVVNQKLRWGGAMFGTDSGDAMHFDLDGHFVDGRKVA